MTTKALFITAMGGAKMPFGPSSEFTRTASDVLTLSGHGLETGAGPYKIMTTGTDAPSGLVAAIRSSLIYTPSTDVQDETVTIDGKVYKWRGTPSADGEVDVNASGAIAADNLAAAINLGVGQSAAYGVSMTGNPNVSAIAFNSTVKVEAKVLDATIGDAIAVAETAQGAWAGGGVLLANGVDGTDYYIIRLTDDTFSVATTKVLAKAGTAVSITDAGTGVHMLVPTVETLAEALEDVLVNYLTYAGARVYPAAGNISKFWGTAIDGAVTEG